MIKEGDLPTLNQLVKILEDSFERLEKSYKNKNSEEFNKSKSLIVQTERRISHILK